MAIEVVRARRDDWETVKGVRLAALSEAPYAFGSTFEREVGRPEDEWRAWIQPDQNDGGRAVFLAFDGGRPIAMAAGFGHEDSAHLVAMWVSPEARQLGLGIRLVEAVVDWARDSGYEAVTLQVAEDNAPAIALYQKLGFQFTGESQPLRSAPERYTSTYAISLR